MSTKTEEKGDKIPAQERASAPQPAAAHEPVSTFELSLDEFCTRLSLTDKRTEMIGAFHHSEKNKGVSKDSESNFNQRFAKFCKLPA